MSAKNPASAKAASRSADKGPPAVRSLARNRRATHDYQVLETFEAGITLAGTEVKSVRQGRIQLKDGYVEFRDGEAYLVGVNIQAYSHGNRQNHLPERPRKLLLHRHQLNKLFGRSLSKGITVVPLEVYLKGPWVKVELGLVQGKKQYDKRQAEKQRTLDQEAREVVKEQRW